MASEPLPPCPPNALQVKVAEHILTGHKVAIKILNRKKIKQMDMEEKGGRKDMEATGGGQRARGAPMGSTAKHSKHMSKVVQQPCS